MMANCTHGKLTNITLIGMPGAGKSTLGKLLAEKHRMGFLDTDRLLEKHQGKTLQQILEDVGYLKLRELESDLIMGLNPTNHVIATGGSAIYSEQAMVHLQAISQVVFLDTGFSILTTRLTDVDTRGLARAPDQSLQQLFEERRPLYQKYAQITICCDGLSQLQLMDKIETVTGFRRGE